MSHHSCPSSPCPICAAPLLRQVQKERDELHRRIALVEAARIRAQDLIDEQVSSAYKQRDEAVSLAKAAGARSDAFRDAFQRLCKLVMRQRRAREAMGEQEWSEELADIEADITDAIASAR